MNNNSNSVNQGLLFIVILLFFIVAGVVAYLVYQNYQLQEKIAVMAPVDQVEPTALPQEDTSAPNEETVSPTDTTSELSADWQTYTSEEYGFQVSFPPDFQALDSEDDLYGWPNAVVLLYRGGQSYDIPIEAWDAAAEYEQKYDPQFDYVVKPVGGKYITLVNYNETAEFADIAATFEEIE